MSRKTIKEIKAAIKLLEAKQKESKSVLDFSSALYGTYASVLRWVLGEQEIHVLKGGKNGS